VGQRVRIRPRRSNRDRGGKTEACEKPAHRSQATSKPAPRR
jgi:hypothetical protein